MTVYYVIKTAPTGPEPIGSIVPTVREMEPPGWKLCNGQYLKCQEWRRLYAVAGDNCCAPVIRHKRPKTWWQRLLRYFGSKTKTRWGEGPNPDYRPGYFRLPDLRGRT